MHVFDTRRTESFREFVEFWRARYEYPLEHLYVDNIGQPLNEERVWQLFRWKNGNEAIARRKKQSIAATYIPQLPNLPELNSHRDGEAYLERVTGGGIWDIFWLHCINRELFPIFDQHTYRAMAHIEAMTVPEIPSVRSAKLRAYFDSYLPFLQRRFACAADRSVDMALFTYGRFLKSPFAR